jgi:integrase
LDYARSNGYIAGDPTQGLSALEPHAAQAKNKKRTGREQPLSLAVCKRLAGHLHPLHQVVFWMQRLLGLRISEAYGFLVGDLLDGGVDGLFAVERQGGKNFRERDEHGRVVTVRRKSRPKTAASYRVVGVPSVLMRLLRLIIDAYHTDPATGEVNLDAPLIPGLQNYDVPSQAGYQAALTKALKAEGLDPATSESRISSHTLRKSFITDLASPALASVTETLRRRIAGHTAGTDVHASVYILDDPTLLPLRRAAEEVDDLVLREITGVVVPTIARPQFGKTNHLKQRLDYIELVWQSAYADQGEGDGDPLCGTDRVAEELRSAPTTARKWMREGKVPTEQAPGRSGRTERLARLSDVRALRDRLAAGKRLPDAAAQLALTYHQAYRMVEQLGLELPRDEHGDFLVDDAAYDALKAEVDRVAALHQRAVTADEARKELGVSLSGSSSRSGEWGVTGPS